MIAVGIVDQNVLRRCLDADALIAIRHFEVVEMAIVRTDQVNAIGAANIWSADGDVVGFEIRNTIEDQMEGRRVDQNKVVDREICDRDEEQ